MKTAVMKARAIISIVAGTAMADAAPQSMMKPVLQVVPIPCRLIVAGAVHAPFEAKTPIVQLALEACDVQVTETELVWPFEVCAKQTPLAAEPVLDGEPVHCRFV